MSIAEFAYSYFSKYFQSFENKWFIKFEEIKSKQKTSYI